MVRSVPLPLLCTLAAVHLLLICGLFFLYRSLKKKQPPLGGPKIGEGSGPAAAVKEASSPGPAIVPGELIAHKYRGIRIIDKNPLGAVWEVRHPRTQDTFILKPINTHRGQASPRERKRLRHRMSQVYMLRHPGIVRVIDLLEGQTPKMIVQELVREETLERVLVSPAGITDAAVRRILEAACDALTYSHQSNVLHLNLKPSNIFLDEKTGARISDFRLAQSPDPESPPPPDGFLAPEIANGPISPAADVYSLGMCLRLMLQNSPGLTAPMAGLIENSTRKDPAQRLQTAAEFREGLAFLPR